MDMEQVAKRASGFDKIENIPLNRVKPDCNQIRKEFKESELIALATSIKENGQLQPILVTLTNDDQYLIIDGERRWRALDKIADDAGRTEAEPTIRAFLVESPNSTLGIVDC